MYKVLHNCIHFFVFTWFFFQLCCISLQNLFNTKKIIQKLPLKWSILKMPSIGYELKGAKVLESTALYEFCTVTHPGQQNNAKSSLSGQSDRPLATARNFNPVQYAGWCHWNICPYFRSKEKWPRPQLFPRWPEWKACSSSSSWCRAWHTRYADNSK